jgi:hypothetical protein
MYACACVHACISLFVCVCMYVCIYAYIHACMSDTHKHTHTHTHTGTVGVEAKRKPRHKLHCRLCSEVLRAYYIGAATVRGAAAVVV